MRTPPDKTIVMTFLSHPTKSLKMRWRMCLSFPPGADAATPLPVTLVDGEGADVAEAVVEVAGRRLRVRDGRASLPYADFVAGKHAKAIWVYRHGMLPIPGCLTFA